MIERIDTFKVTVTLKGEDEKIHLLKREEELSVNYNLYNTAEQALESFLHFIKIVYEKECTDAICFDEKPFIYEVIDDKKSISAYRVVMERFSHEAIFLLNSFKNNSLNDILRFLKDYAESECSKDFSAISLLPSIESKARVIDTDNYGFSFKKDEIKNLSMEDLKEKLLGTKLIGYLHL